MAPVVQGGDAPLFSGDSLPMPSTQDSPVVQLGKEGKMEVTNKYNLPYPFVKALTGDRRQPVEKRVGVTTLIKPPRMAALERQNWDKTSVDASEMMYALLGNAFHKIIEDNSEGDPDLEAAELKLEGQYFGWTVSGIIDRISKSGVITDWKTTSVWSAVYGNVGWEPQLNVYAQLARDNGYDIRGLSIFSYFRDWNERRSFDGGSYPDHMWGSYDIPLWSEEKAKLYIQEQVTTLEAALDGENVLCSEEDRWATADTYAVMKPGAKRASRVFDSEEQAKEYLYSDVGKGKVELRIGEKFKRCQRYCGASAFCQQYQEGVGNESA